MPFISRRADQPIERFAGAARATVLDPARTGDGRIAIDRWLIEAGHRIAVEIADSDLAWIEVLRGDGRLGDHDLTPDIMTLLPPGLSSGFEAADETELLVSRIPDAARFDPGFTDRPPALKSFDWTHEPVLQSEHDGRKRIYLATGTLFATTAIKGEMIIYPPGATCPEHHHEGAEHYQFVLKGSGTAVLGGTEEVLHEGDLLYNFENELHWFYNAGDTDLVFVEYFVPGDCRTVWVPEAKICAWMPTGADLQGRAPSRDIPYHSHGDATPV